MSKKKIVDLTFELAQPIVENNNFELVDVEYVKEGSNWYLRIFIEKDGGINIDDCQVISEKLGEKLDKLDPIKTAYHLEVSSPGLDRPLKSERDFKRYAGETVEVFLYKSLDGSKEFKGTLKELKENKLYIVDSNGQELIFEREKISKVRRYFEF
jgi:ribosome maturation factor RimP